MAKSNLLFSLLFSLLLAFCFHLSEVARRLALRSTDPGPVQAFYLANVNVGAQVNLSCQGALAPSGIDA